MLDLHIETADLHGAWCATRAGWACGGSHLDPFRNAALESFAFASPRRLLFVVRERSAGVPSAEGTRVGDAIPMLDEDAWERQLAAATQWPLQFVTVVIATDASEPRVQLESGDWANGAVFLVARPEVLTGCWDAGRLYRHLPEPRLDPVLASHFLASFDVPYSRRTMFAGMQVMTHRSRARWDGSGLTIDYPAPVEAPAPMLLKPDADVVAAFRKIVRSSMARWLPPGFRGASAELSGGLDSAIVAATASDLLDTPLLTQGIILLGEMGEEQRSRRHELIARFGFSDDTVDISDFIPLHAGSTRLTRTPAVPWEDCYYEALEAMLQRAAARGAAIVFTGIGGDELCGPGLYNDVDTDRAGEARQPDDPFPAFLTDRAQEIVRGTEGTLDHAPMALVCSSSLCASQRSSALAMRLGLWTINPLCTPELVAFCDRLPPEWRRDRAVERRTLESLGCSRNVFRPPAPDDFSSACVRGVRSAGRATIEALFRDSRLAELGLVDRDRLLADYRQWCDSGRSDGDLPFYAAAILEQVLRQ
ncbi:asparagine synthase (glutamine-hydrolyzing) [Burkholderia ambifaria]|nr:asparagine synthase-related protein [Burkholderia ambifaria]MDR6498178.1 asparagine synthase (glutamine-hydrolyzing) [Burkholderia ambifaria]